MQHHISHKKIISVIYNSSENRYKTCETKGFSVMFYGCFLQTKGFCRKCARYLESDTPLIFNSIFLMYRMLQKQEKLKTVSEIQ